MPKTLPLVLAFLLSPAAARADRLEREMGRLRTAVGEYDPNGNLSQIVWDLGALSLSPRGRIAMEARYLRARVVTDVLVYLEVHPAPWLRERIALAMGARPADLERVVRMELETIESPFVPDAQVLERTLDALESGAITRPHAEDPAGAILFVSRLARLGRAEAARAIASIGRDPCPSADACPAPYAGLTAADRRAVEGLAAAARALRSTEAPSAGDPLGSLVFPLLGHDAAAVRAIEVATTPQGGWPTLEAPGAADVTAPHVLVGVGVDGVRVAEGPVFRIDVEGRVRTAPGPCPAFPASIVIPGRDRRATTVLSDLLVASTSGGDRTIGLYVDPAAPASALARVVAAIAKVPDARVSLALGGPDGTRFVAADFAAPGRFPASARGAGRLRVLVTPIGYWIFEGDREPVQVPLVAESGAHDLSGLESRLGTRERESAAVAVRGELSVRPVLLAALALRRAGTEIPTVVVTP